MDDQQENHSVCIARTYQLDVSTRDTHPNQAKAHPKLLFMQCLHDIMSVHSFLLYSEPEKPQELLRTSKLQHEDRMAPLPATYRLYNDCRGTPNQTTSNCMQLALKVHLAMQPNDCYLK